MPLEPGAWQPASLEPTRKPVATAAEEGPSEAAPVEADGAVPGADAARSAPARRAALQLLLPLASLLGLTAFLAIASPHFLTGTNLRTVLSDSAELAIAAIGMTWIMVAGGIDLSVGSMMGLCGVLSVAALQRLGAGAPAAVALACVVAVAVLAGLACGLVNGALTVGLRVQAFIATLGTLGAYRGLALLLTDGVPVTQRLPPAFARLAGDVGPVPVPLLFVGAVAAGCSFALRRTRLGRRTYAIGSNAEAARLSGIAVRRHLLWIYGIGGALTGLAAAINASRTVSGSPTAGQGFELDVIAAVVIGGGSLNGGAGTVSGSLIGALLMEVLRNGCVLLEISPYFQLVVIGAVVVLAVAVDDLRRRRMR